MYLDVLSEVKRPEKNLKLSIFGSFSLISISYVLTNISYVSLPFSTNYDITHANVCIMSPMSCDV